MNRRELFRVGAGSLTAGALMAQQHEHIVTPASTAQATATDWSPSVFDSHQNETVIVLTELIIPETDTPGAKAANVNRYIDLFLRDGDPERRVQFLEGLSWLDGYSIRQAGAPFVRLPETQQTKILETLDAGEDPSVKTGHAFFRMVKAMTAQIYYATEIGFRELNKGGRVPSGFGCNGRNNA
jgi:hypothetical protein